jgi:hypothetical protein
LAWAACAHQAPKPVAKVEAPPPPPPPAERPDDMAVEGTLGTLSDDEISGPFQRRWDEITRCYEDATTRLAYLGGRIELKLRVTQTGEPKSAWVAGSTFGNYDAERCILGIARSLRFSKPRGGPEAEFTYPIEFRGKRPVTTWDGGRVEPSLMRR